MTTTGRFFTAALVAAFCSASVEAQTPSQPLDTVGMTTLDTLYQTYEEPAISLPLGVGLGVPSYDRVNGLSLPWGPRIRVPGGRIRIDPRVTYRSNLGKLDPSVTSTIAFGRFDSLYVYGGRGTFTNDGWIRSDFTNSLAAIGVGSDARNYFRADRVTALLSHAFPAGDWTTSLSAGGQFERDWSTGLHGTNTNAPWSFFGRTDVLKMRRPNPLVTPGHLASALAGIDSRHDTDDLKLAVNATVEHAFHRPEPGVVLMDDIVLVAGENDNFTQATVNVTTAFPTFGTQSFAFRGHALATSGSAPPQRFSYLGGAGTLATVDLLALGGDRLVFVEGEYRYPLTRPIVPLVGAPILSARYAAGSAGVDELPDFIQNIGVGIGFTFFKLQYDIDPNYTKTPFTDRHAFSVSLSLPL